MNCHPPPPLLYIKAVSLSFSIYMEIGRQTGVYYVIEKNAVLNVIKIKNRALIRMMKYFSTVAAARVK